MTPEDLTPEDEAVLRLLAALSFEDPALEAPAPMPAEVATRLDDVLAGLVADRAPRPGRSAETISAETTVVDLAKRRRRRWPAALVAAASVAVIALGVGTVFNNRSFSGSGSTSAADSTADRLIAPDATSGLDAADGLGGEAPGVSTTPAPSLSARDQAESLGQVDGTTADRRLPEIRTGSLAADVQRIADSRLFDRAADFSLLRKNALAGKGCTVPRTGKHEQALAVRLDGKPATLVLRAPDAGTRDAQVYSCDNGETPVATTHVQAR